MPAYTNLDTQVEKWLNYLRPSLHNHLSSNEAYSKVKMDTMVVNDLFKYAGYGNVELGQYEQDGQTFFVIFDNIKGDWVFDTVEGVINFFKMTPPAGPLYWVSPNEPLDVEQIEWEAPNEDGEIKGWFNK